jgi:hypothetical protein
MGPSTWAKTLELKINHCHDSDNFKEISFHNIDFVLIISFVFLFKESIISEEEVIWISDFWGISRTYHPQILQ